MSHPLLPLPARTKETDEVYSILGRALAYASEFESNCRILAHLFDIEQAERANRTYMDVPLNASQVQPWQTFFAYITSAATCESTT